MFLFTLFLQEVILDNRKNQNLSYDFSNIGLPQGALSDHGAVISEVTIGNDKFRVMNWNVLQRQEGLGDRAQRNPANKVENHKDYRIRAELQIKRIKQEMDSVDIIALQETDHLYRYLDKLKNDKWVVVHYKDDKSKIKMTTLYDKNIFNDIKLTSNSLYFSNSKILANQFSINGKDFVFANTHADYSTKFEEFKKPLSLQCHTKVPIIVAGDMNHPNFNNEDVSKWKGLISPYNSTNYYKLGGGVIDRLGLTDIRTYSNKNYDGVILLNNDDKKVKVKLHKVNTFAEDFDEKVIEREDIVKEYFSQIDSENIVAVENKNHFKAKAPNIFDQDPPSHYIIKTNNPNQSLRTDNQDVIDAFSYQRYQRYQGIDTCSGFLKIKEILEKIISKSIDYYESKGLIFNAKTFDEKLKIIDTLFKVARENNGTHEITKQQWSGIVQNNSALQKISLEDAQYFGSIFQRFAKFFKFYTGRDGEFKMVGLRMKRISEDMVKDCLENLGKRSVFIQKVSERTESLFRRKYWFRKEQNLYSGVNIDL